MADPQKRLIQGNKWQKLSLLNVDFAVIAKKRKAREEKCFLDGEHNDLRATQSASSILNTSEYNPSHLRKA